MNTTDLSQFSPKWQFRFNFFRQHGAPKNPGFKQAWKALSFGDRLKINLNFFALFFGAIYLLILGMWRKALVVNVINILLATGEMETETAPFLLRKVQSSLRAPHHPARWVWSRRMPFSLLFFPPHCSSF